MTTYTWKTCQSNSWTDTDCWEDGAYPNDATATTKINLTIDLTISFNGQGLPGGFSVGNLSITTSNGSALTFNLPYSEGGSMSIDNLVGNADLTFIGGGFCVIKTPSDYKNTISVSGVTTLHLSSLPFATIQLTDSSILTTSVGKQITRIYSLIIDNNSIIYLYGTFSIGASFCPLNSICGNYRCTVTESYLNYQTLSKCESLTE